MAEDIIVRDKWFSLKWAVALLLPVTVGYFTWNSGIPIAQVKFYTITMIALTVWALDLLPDALVATVLPVLYIVAGIGTPPQILNSWSTPVGWVVLGGLALGCVALSTGFARRIALWSLYVTRGSFARVLWGIFLAGVILAPLIPTVMGKAALFTVICAGICEALNLERGSRPASAIMMAGLIAVCAPKNGLLTGGADTVMMVRQLSNTMGVEITWMDYFIHNALFSLIYGVVSIFVLLLVLRPKLNTNYGEYVISEFKNLPALSGAEKRLAFLCVAMLLMFMTEEYHKVNAAWVLMMLMLIMALPGVNLLNKQTFNKLQLSALLFVVGCMSIGSAAQMTGADQSLASMIAPHFEGASGLYGMIIGYLSGTAINFLLTPLAALASMTVPLTKIVMEAGANPIPVIYCFNYGLDQYIFPYEFAVLLYFFASGWISLKHIMAVFSIRFVVGGILLVCVAYPWWKMLGLL